MMKSSGIKGNISLSDEDEENPEGLEQGCSLGTSEQPAATFNGSKQAVI